MPDQKVAVAPADTTRLLQLCLAAIWLLDGLLQAQPYMYRRGFAHDVLAASAQGNPGIVAGSIRQVADWVHSAPGPWNGAFVVIQLGIGILIAVRHTVRIGLAGSVIWGVGVWVFGEGLGGLLTGSASIWTGAPGAALLYSLVAVLLWPGLSDRISSRLAVTSWVMLWGLLALLNLLPDNRSANSFHDTVSGMATANPSWLNHLLDDVAQLGSGRGLEIAIVMTISCALVALGGLLPARRSRTPAIGAILLALVAWVFGQAGGALLGGQATDPNAGPLLVLIALAYPFGRGVGWRRPGRSSTAAGDPHASVVAA